MTLSKHAIWLGIDHVGSDKIDDAAKAYFVGIGYYHVIATHFALGIELNKYRSDAFFEESKKPFRLEQETIQTVFRYAF